MKPLLLAIVIICVVAGVAPGQNAGHANALEPVIRKLELDERDAVLRSDVAALEKLWAEDFTVNNPQSTISRGRTEVLDRVRSGLLKYSSFVREIESIGFYDDTVIVMGMEEVTPIGDTPRAGQTLRRRYTNIWMKRQGKWLLTARHANVICSN